MNEFVEAFDSSAATAPSPASRSCRASLHLTLETLKVGAIGVAISLVDRAARSGVWLGHIHRGSFVAINVGNLGRALPSLAVLAIGDAFLGLGLAVVELALVVLAVPPIITNAYLGVDGVDPELVDAARGMGMSELGDPAPRRAAARDAADLRRHPHRGGVRRQHDHDRRAGRLQRQPRRRHRQRDQLPLLRACSAPRSAWPRSRSPSTVRWRWSQRLLTPRGLRLRSRRATVADAADAASAPCGGAAARRLAVLIAFRSAIHDKQEAGMRGSTMTQGRDLDRQTRRDAGTVVGALSDARARRAGARAGGVREQHIVTPARRASDHEPRPQRQPGPASASRR